MEEMIFNIYRTIRFVYSKTYIFISNIITKLLLFINNADVGSNFKSNGIPKLYIHHTGKFSLERDVKLNNTVMNNPIGRNAKCIFVIRENAILSIGKNTGMSGVTIVCQKEIIIKDNVKIGGNVCIYDTDFHSLNANDRNIPSYDKDNTNKKKVYIGNNVFIGAHSTILKGVTIGKNSIIGACSVVTKDINNNEIWAGNPAKLIKKIDENK
jgi:acetyltransferase-like isoleucine patch superfamily enzyme